MAARQAVDLGVRPGLTEAQKASSISGLKVSRGCRKRCQKTQRTSEGWKKLSRSKPDAPLATRYLLFLRVLRR